MTRTEFTNDWSLLRTDEWISIQNRGDTEIEILVTTDASPAATEYGWLYRKNEGEIRRNVADISEDPSVVSQNVFIRSTRFGVNGVVVHTGGSL